MIGQPLSPADFDRLQRCGISPEIADAAKLRRVDNREGGEILGRNGSGNYAGLLFPYHWPGNPGAREYRIRRDHPDLEQTRDGLKEKNKYLGPPGSRNLLYFHPDVAPAWLNDTTIDIVITEGEKKTLALWGLAWHGVAEASERPEFLPIGLAGVWSWRGTVGKTVGPDGERRDRKGVIPDFDKMAWKGRKVVILFDRNVATNESVHTARAMLAKELRERGAEVYLFDWPSAPDNVNGIDDLLGIWTPGDVLALIRTNMRPATVEEDAETIEWPEPQPITETSLREVPPLPASLLPDPYRGWIIDTSERMGCPVEIVAIAAIVGTGSVIGAGCGIHPKRRDDWTVVPNLWGGAIGRPSILLKTPALEAGNTSAGSNGQ
jgi:hypothetical protein